MRMNISVHCGNVRRISQMPLEMLKLLKSRAAPGLSWTSQLGALFLLCSAPISALGPQHWLLLPPPKGGVCQSNSGTFKQPNSQQMWGELQTRNKKPTGDRWNSLNFSSPETKEDCVSVFQTNGKTQLYNRRCGE